MRATSPRASPTSRASQIDVPRMETNLVFFEITKPGWTSAKLVEACKRARRRHRRQRRRRASAPSPISTSTAPDIDSALKVISDALAA